MENFQPLHVDTDLSIDDIDFEFENQPENLGETTSEDQNETDTQEVINVHESSNKKTLHPVWEHFVVTKTEVKCQIKGCKVTLSLPQNSTHAKRHLELIVYLIVYLNKLIEYLNSVLNRDLFDDCVPENNMD
jgi:hypothetical protein